MKRILSAAVLALVACTPASPPASAPEPAAEHELAGRWDVQQIAGASLGQGVDVWIEVAADGETVSGFTGCNSFTSSIASFGAGVTFAPVVEGEGECAGPEAATDEARFLGVLPSVQRFIRNGRALELLPSAAGSEALLNLRLADEAPQ